MRHTLWMLATALILSQSASAQKRISPQQAIDAVRQFWNNPNLEPKVERLAYEGFRLYDFYYDVQVQDGEIRQEYQVGASDGVIYSIGFVGPESPAPPQLPPQEALAIAENFVKQHYPPFSNRRWFLMPQKYWQHLGSYGFEWHEVLNESGALAPWWISVTLDGTTGRIIGYGIPPNRTLLAPTVPRVTLQQAKQVAAPYTPYDVRFVPFDEAYLWVTEDRFGTQWLYWILYQNPPEQAADPTPKWIVFVDALTGEVARWGGPLNALGKGAKVPGLPRSRIRLRTAEGRALDPSVCPMIKNSTLWIRVELLRGFGARVQADKKGAEVSWGDKTITGTEVGAKWRDYGWWVPLRRTASALGWQVEWRPGVREVVLRP